MRRQGLSRVVVAVAFASMVASCSSGGGDLNKLVIKPVTLGTPASKANTPATRAPHCSQFVARNLIVVAVDNYDEKNDGRGIGSVYVQDPLQPTAWSGMVLFNPTKNPPDLELVPGQGIDVSGTFIHFEGHGASNDCPPPSNPPMPTSKFPDGIVLPEVIKGAVSLVSENAPPVPIDLDLAEATKTNENAMSYVGRLVKVKNVNLKADYNPLYREAAITDDKKVTLASQLFSVEDVPKISLKRGATIKSVTGVFNYFYGWKLCPRSPADIEL